MRESIPARWKPRRTFWAACLLYAIVLAWPEDGTVTVRSLGSRTQSFRGDVKSVDLLGATTPVKWTRDEGGLHVALPAVRPSAYALALRIATH
jgi:alpha-L-fucosidase